MSERIHQVYDGDGNLLHVETWSLDTNLYIREDPPGTTVESRPLTDAERAGLIVDTHPSDADRLAGLESRLGVAVAWVAGEPVQVGDRRTYQGRAYGCIQAHTTQADWTPDATPALWGDQGASAPSPADWVDQLREVRSQVEGANNANQVRDAVLAVVDTLTGDA